MLVAEVIQQGAPERVALYGDTPVTYRELGIQVAKFREVMAAKGVGRGDRVGLLATNSPTFIYTYFATQELGAVTVPLNSMLTDTEADYIVRDAGVRLLVAMKPVEVSCEVLLMEELARQAAQVEATPAPSLDGVKDTDVCTLIYTSGTTGRPKGAMLSHRNLVSNVRQFNQALPHHASDNVLCALPMYHCFGWTTCVMNPLLVGAGITPVASPLPSEITKAIATHGVTVVFLVPPLYHLLSRAGDVNAMATVRLFVSGGASLPEPVARGFEERFGHAILEGYGLSEASPVVAVNLEEKNKLFSIGPALPTVDVRIDGTDDADYRPGTIGELLVRGDNVMSGYWNLPEASAEALKDGWLHTGDLAYMDEDRYIYIVDRSKDMVIVNGENVYPREVEDAMYQFPGISEVAVVGHKDGLRGQYVCAYVVMKDGETFDKQRMRRFLSERLAGFKLPRKYVVLDALPKNSTGKILKRVLQESETFSEGSEPDTK